MAAAAEGARMLPDGGGGADDEERWLAEGVAGVQQSAFYMHHALDSNNLKDALKFSSQMLSELRTSRLSPHKYYELYMRAFDELRKLEMFFREETQRGGCSVIDLYELVQHAGNVLPRLPLHCLKRALTLRIAHVAQQMAIVTRGSSGSVILFIEILNKYLYFFEKGNPDITNTVIQDFIELIKTEKQSENNTSDPSAESYFASTLRCIEFEAERWKHR